MPIRGIPYEPNYALHPGSTLAEKLEELNVSPQDFAQQIGVEEDIIVNIVMEKEEAVITPQLAEALHKALNIPAHFWINRQRHYDESLVNQQVAM